MWETDRRICSLIESLVWLAIWPVIWPQTEDAGQALAIGLAGGANKVPNAERLELQRRGVKPILGNLANVGGRLPGGRRVDLLGELP